MAPYSLYQSFSHYLYRLFQKKISFTPISKPPEATNVNISPPPIYFIFIFSTYMTYYKKVKYFLRDSNILLTHIQKAFTPTRNAKFDPVTLFHKFNLMPWIKIPIIVIGNFLARQYLKLVN